MAMMQRAVPGAGCVDIWLVGAGLEPDGLDRIALDASETARAERMATAALAARALRRRRFLKWVLAAYLGGRPDAVDLALAPGGKPFLEPDAGFHFNLSHSGDVSAVAISAAPIGLDIEAPKSFGRLEEVVVLACSPRERATIARAADPTAAFLDRWVLKEAILKCRGTGLVDDLPTVDPGPLADGATAWSDLSIRALRTPDGLVSGPRLHMALAVKGRCTAVNWPQS